VDDGYPDGLISIGEFAQRTRLSSKWLRIYDRIGLLRPAAVKEANRYRRYSVDQIRTGQLIGMMRGAELSLADVRLVLDDLDQDRGRAITRIERLVDDIERRHATRKLLLGHIQATISEGDDPMFLIKTRHVPARRVMSIQRRLNASDTDSFVREAKTAFAEHLGTSEPAAPFTLIFHGVVDADNDGPLEAVLGCPEDIHPTDTIGIRTEPAHDVAYTTITKAQWAYPAILAAYDAVNCSPEVRNRPGRRLSCREVYLAEPDAINDGDLVCDVAFPLAGE